MKHAELKKYLEQTGELLEQNEQKSGNVLKSNDPNKVKALLDDRFPASSQTFSELLNDFQQQVYPSLNHNTSTLFGAYITGSGNKIGALAEFIKAFYNQNGLKRNNSPIASELEQLVIQWIAEFCQLSRPRHRSGTRRQRSRPHRSDAPSQRTPPAATAKCHVGTGGTTRIVHRRFIRCFARDS